VRAVTGAGGGVTETAVYRPFGEQQERVLDASAAGEDKGFIGERFDADAGLQYLNARYYDPKLGLFLQPDWFEVTEPGVGRNRYSYSFNDPVNLSDPGGNSWLDRTWDRVFGEGSFNRTFGDRASAWSDRTFGNQRDQVYAAAWTGPGRYSTTYHEWKRHQEQPVYASGEAASGDFVFDVLTAGAGATVKAGLRAGYKLGRGVWDLPPIERGRVIEQRLGQNLHPSFPVIDKVGGGVATSIKSLDLAAASYRSGTRVLSTVTRHINKLDQFNGASFGGSTVVTGLHYTSKALEVAIPSMGNAAQRYALSVADSYARNLGISLITTIVRR
jgi:RHS repeat-associated protein